MIVLEEADVPGRLTLGDDLLIRAENAVVLGALPDGAFDLIYIDPPFNTGAPQTRRTLSVVRDEAGTPGFGGRGYTRRELGRSAYADDYEDYVGFLGPRLERARDLLAGHGTLYVHLDGREAHYVKVELDRIFGRECFLNEIIWVYDYGGKTKRRWPAKHDTILVYVRDRDRYWFDSEAADREPYMAPGLVGPEKAGRGKLPTDVWWHTIVPTRGREKTGYPTQKPEGVVRRIVGASSRPGGWCLDFFAGSGTLGAVARAMGRRFVLVDSNPEAIAVARARLGAPS
ncbi:MAG TPA: site-specific DNA-methyltransferase [Solirubrobacteraceae bacterium]|nr:site-specific DNA-methyltransferase [Solirubrobacteraceae bacterium]